MQNIFVWLTDITEYAKEQNCTPQGIYSQMVNVAKKNGYDCDKSWTDIVGNSSAPRAGISMEVDRIDGLCFSAGIDQEAFQKVTVSEWLEQ